MRHDLPPPGGLPAERAYPDTAFLNDTPIISVKCEDCMTVPPVAYEYFRKRRDFMLTPD